MKLPNLRTPPNQHLSNLSNPSNRRTHMDLTSSLRDEVRILDEADHVAERIRDRARKERRAAAPGYASGDRSDEGRLLLRWRRARVRRGGRLKKGRARR